MVAPIRCPLCVAEAALDPYAPAAVARGEVDVLRAEVMVAGEAVGRIPVPDPFARRGKRDGGRWLGVRG